MNARALPVLLTLALAAVPALARDRDRPPFPVPGDERPVREPESGPGLQEELADYVGSGREDEVILPGHGLSIRGLELRNSGDWRLGFFLTETVTWDDNVLLTERGSRSDVELNTMLGGRALREGASIATDVTAAVGFQKSVRDGGLDFAEGFLRLGVARERGSGYVRASLRGGSREDSRLEVQGTAAGGGIEVGRGDPVRQNLFTLEAAAGSRPEPGGWEVRYAGSLEDYDGAASDLSGTRHSLEGELRYAVSPRMSVFGGAGVRRVVRFSDAYSDQDGATAFVGGRWNAGARTDLHARVGYLSQRPDGASATGDDRSFSGVTAAIGAGWRPTPKTTFSLDFDRDVVPSITGNYERIDRVRAGWQWDVDAMWRAGADATAQWSSPSDGESARLYGAAVHVGVILRRGLDLRVFFDRASRSSRAPGGDYTASRAGVQVSVLF